MESEVVFILEVIRVIYPLLYLLSLLLLSISSSRRPCLLPSGLDCFELSKLSSSSRPA